MEGVCAGVFREAGYRGDGPCHAGEASPSPVYEGQSGVIAYLLDGPEASYTVALPEPGQPLRAILETFTAHAAVNHAQAFIDLACELRPQVDLQQVREVVHTNSAVHTIVGTGSNDPAKYDPDASRETLDHLGLSCGRGAGGRQLSPRTQLCLRTRPPPATIALWRRVHSVIDPAWEALYRQALPDRPALGGRLEIHLNDGRVISGEKAVADAHTHGARPMDHAGYVAKFRGLAGPMLASEVLEAFLHLVHRLPEATPEALSRLNPPLPSGRLHADTLDGRGIFDHGLAVTDR